MYECVCITVLYLHAEVHTGVAEGTHGVNVACWNKSLEKRNGSWHSLFGKEGNDTDLCQSSIVQFGDQTSFLGLSTLVLGEAKRIVEVQGTSWDDRRIKSWEFTNLASLHVVLLTCNFTVL